MTVDDSGIQQALTNLSDVTQKTRPLMRQIGAIMHVEVEKNFDAEGRPKWQDLAESTIDQRKRKGYWPGKMLQRTGRLVASISASSEESSAVVGTNLIYAPIQQFGGTVELAARSSLFAQKRTKKGKFKKGTEKEAAGGKGKITYKARSIVIPPRPFLMLPESGVQKVVKAIEQFIARALLGIKK